MRVTYVNTTPSDGGAARACHRLFRAAQSHGIDARLFVSPRTTDEQGVVPLRIDRGPVNRVRRFVRRLGPRLELLCYEPWMPAGAELFTDDRWVDGALPAAQLPECDVIHMHWVAFFLDYQTWFPRLPAHVPIVWTLHDMNPFTGGCHYASGCERFTASCGRCPRLGSTRENDLSQQIHQRKARSLASIADHRLQIVTPSRWMADKARASSLLGRFDVRVIPNCLDTDTFSPQDRDAARRELGIPAEALVMLFVAQTLDNRRKGFEHIVEAARLLRSHAGLFLLSVGSSAPVLSTSLPHKHLGAIHSDALLARVYSAADVFVIPSLEDNLPNTVMEAMACGTPVVGFDSGGIREMLGDPPAGGVVPCGDVGALVAAIARLLENRAHHPALRSAARQWVLRNYSVEAVIDGHAKLYQELLARQRRA
jgi:glycosyltransferase involved in cell wall biosynthesis